MSFVEFLMKYYIWILVVLIVAIVTTAIATEKNIIKNIKVNIIKENIVTLDINRQLHNYKY